MTFAAAALLLQVLAIPQNLSSTVSEIARATVADTSAKPDLIAPTVSLDPVQAGEPLPTSGSRASAELLSVPDLHGEDIAAAPLSLSGSGSMPLPKSQLQDRSKKLQHREWLVLSIAQHGAATFDAWSTRHAVSGGKAQESNPILRPFAGNASIYAAIQVGPVVFDYLGRRMMTSQHGWARHTWWILQAVSTVTSLASGAHNLSIH